WLLTRTLYRIRLSGLENIPETGACVIVSNHVSFVDALIMGGNIRRPVRFVMYYKIFEIPVLNFIFRTARAIPIAGKSENEALMLKAFDEIDAALRAGDVVGLYPEGGLTADGEVQPFRPGIERIVERTPAPVVPMALRGLWSSMWSRRDSRMRRMRLPRRFRARIELVAEPPVPPEHFSAAGLEAQVRRMRGPDA
ncbi:MAG TPA: lysophospholipid acyltransferase family protein, partial [Solimonas sp.]|nr:lysophospholipid acyltransferase family protein [Solimonas sp.]